MRNVATILLTGLSVLAAGLAGEPFRLTEDQPPLPSARAGDVDGAVTPAGKVAELWAVSRVTGKTYRPERFDRETGKFLFKALPGDATYDICLRTKDGRDVEGIDLSFTDARLLRLAAKRRKQLGLKPERTHAFGPGDVKELTEFIDGHKDFMDIRRILYLKGHGIRATALVELMRTRAFHAGGGNLVWRIELWYFKYQYGGWERVANQERVLRRQRTSPDAWRRSSIEYYPKLSVYVDRKGYAKTVRFEIPEKPGASRGRPANTPVKLKTQPHVLGLDVKEEPTTRPTSD